MGLLPDTQICGCACAGNAGNVFPVSAGKWSRHASRHVRHARAVMHVGISFEIGGGGKRSRHSRRMRNLQFYVSGKRPMDLLVADDLTPKVHPNRLYCMSYSQTLQSVLYQQYFSINYMNIKKLSRHVYTQCLISLDDTIPIVYDQYDLTLSTAWMTQQNYQYQTLTFQKTPHIRSSSTT